MSKYDDLLDIIKEEKGVLVADIMPDDMKKEVLKLEMKRLDEMVPLINKGLQEAFDEEEAIIVVKHKPDTLPDEELIPTLTLQSESGRIIGEEIYDEEELEELQNDPNVYFISEHFATYTNLSTPGEKQFFVVSALRGELECEEKIEKKVENMIIATPSTEADHYIKDCYNIPHEERIVTVVIGFTK